MVCLNGLTNVVRRFVADERGNAGLEFVTSIPLLLGVLVFTAEYGEALRARMVLDNALHDVARYLARSPVDDISTIEGVREPVFYQASLDQAEADMAARVLNTVAFDAQLISLDQGSFRSDYYIIAARASTFVELPLLSLINVFSEDPNDGDDRIEEGETSFHTPNPLQLVMTSETQVRWLGGSEPGSADCLYSDRLQGNCP